MSGAIFVASFGGEPPTPQEVEAAGLQETNLRGCKCDCRDALETATKKKRLFLHTAPQDKLNVEQAVHSAVAVVNAEAQRVVEAGRAVGELEETAEQANQKLQDVQHAQTLAQTNRASASEAKEGAEAKQKEEQAAVEKATGEWKARQQVELQATAEREAKQSTHGTAERILKAAIDEASQKDAEVHRALATALSKNTAEAVDLPDDEPEPENEPEPEDEQLWCDHEDCTESTDLFATAAELRQHQVEEHDAVPTDEATLHQLEREQRLEKAEAAALIARTRATEAEHATTKRRSELAEAKTKETNAMEMALEGNKMYAAAQKRCDGATRKVTLATKVLDDAVEELERVNSEERKAHEERMNSEAAVVMAREQLFSQICKEKAANEALLRAEANLQDETDRLKRDEKALDALQSDRSADWHMACQALRSHRQGRVRPCQPERQRGKRSLS